jgi:hypothetical protein
MEWDVRELFRVIICIGDGGVVVLWALDRSAFRAVSVFSLCVYHDVCDDCDTMEAGLCLLD